MKRDIVCLGKPPVSAAFGPSASMPTLPVCAAVSSTAAGVPPPLSANRLSRRSSRAPCALASSLLRFTAPSRSARSLTYRDSSWLTAARRAWSALFVVARSSSLTARCCRAKGHISFSRTRRKGARTLPRVELEVAGCGVVAMRCVSGLVSSPAGLDTNPLTHRIATTPQPATSSSTLGRVLTPFRRVLLKLMWPFALQQRAVNEELLATAKEVDQSLRAALNQLESRYAKDRADLLGAVNHNREQGERLDRLERRLAETAGDTSAPQTSSAAGTGGFSRQAISRLVTPFTAQQQKINDQLFTAVRTLGEKLGGLVPRVEAADRLVAETRALPYVSGSPFEIFEEPVAGRVQGYGRRNGDPERAGTYDAFEDIFRGPEHFIRDRQRRYLHLLGDREPVLDIGCGRGEFLDLLRERGLAYAGTDPDPYMVGRCKAKGHERVEVADANSYLEKCADDSIGAIFCAQVIEHMPYEELLRFYSLG